MSIATKVVIQMNAKLGGEPWKLKVPLKKCMIVGFDAHHGTKGNPSVGATVASMTDTFASYFSVTSYHADCVELSKNLCQHLRSKSNFLCLGDFS